MGFTALDAAFAATTSKVLASKAEAGDAKRSEVKKEVSWERSEVSSGEVHHPNWGSVSAGGVVCSGIGAANCDGKQNKKRSLLVIRSDRRVVFVSTILVAAC